MADVLSRGNLFPESIVKEMISKVKGKSSLAALCEEKPISFNGQREFTFTMDKEVDVVAENGAKTKGGVTVAPVTVVPIKIEYGARVSDEFLYASEEEKIEILTSFSDGFAKKAARGLDLMAMHGVNPRTGAPSAVIGDNHFDSKIANKIIRDKGKTADEEVEAAIALVTEKENEVTGAVFSPAFKADLAALKTADGHKLYQELAWGNNPGTINGLHVETNSTVSANQSKDRAIVGDFANCFRWGYAKQMPIEIIKFGNPDNDQELGDLKGHNQIYIRCEAYIGWGILDPDSFAWIVEGEDSYSAAGKTPIVQTPNADENKEK